MSPPLPKQSPIPGYELVRILGMNLGTVYLARHTNSGALVALKVLSREHADRIREHDGPVAGLDHPNIIHVVGMGEFGDHCYLAWEYVGTTLAQRLANGPLPDEEVARLAEAVALALEYARFQGVTCSNLSPGDILFTDDNVPKLMSFCRS
jgi:serine/threonine protein kinase